jgi:hypothetical protein
MGGAAPMSACGLARDANHSATESLPAAGTSSTDIRDPTKRNVCPTRELHRGVSVAYASGTPNAVSADMVDSNLNRNTSNCLRSRTLRRIY